MRRAAASGAAEKQKAVHFSHDDDEVIYARSVDSASVGELSTTDSSEGSGEHEGGPEPQPGPASFAAQQSDQSESRPMPDGINSIVANPVSDDMNSLAEHAVPNGTNSIVECPASACINSTISDEEDGDAARRSAARVATRGSLLERIRGHTRNFTRRAGSFNGSRHEQIRELMGLLEPGMALGHFSDFAKAYVDEACCRRLLSKYPDNVPRCAEKLKQALTWREQNRVLLTTRRCPQGGDYRVIGADLERRPVLYMCMRNQLLPLGQCVDFMMVAMLQAIDNMPAGVETATHVWDLHGMMLRLNWNPAPLVAILKAAEGYFAERMHQLIIIDMPRMAGFIKDAVWPLVPEKTKEKVRFMSAEEAQTYMGAEYSEEVAGRIRGVMAQNRDSTVSLEERKRSWMRVNERAELVPAFA